ncbi:hypothetical protein DLM76_20800 [Leptospira yasudae]|nr:hypothetical protein DLM76_20800 [Leptospira yasudae]
MSTMTIIFIYIMFKKNQELKTSEEKINQIDSNLIETKYSVQNIAEITGTIKDHLQDEVMPKVDAVYQNALLKKKKHLEISDLIKTLESIKFNKYAYLNDNKDTLLSGIKIGQRITTFIFRVGPMENEVTVIGFSFCLTELPDDMKVAILEMNAGFKFGQIGLKKVQKGNAIIVTKNIFINDGDLESQVLNYVLTGILQAFDKINDIAISKKIASINIQIDDLNAV